MTFGRVCGMHEGMSTKVSVFSVDGDKSVFLGNAVTVDVIPGANPSPAGPGGGPTVWVAWTSPTQLSVTYSQRAKANKVSFFFWWASLGCRILAVPPTPSITLTRSGLGCPPGLQHLLHNGSRVLPPTPPRAA